MFPKIIDVKPEKNYLIHILYQNDEIRILDMKPCLDFGIFKELENEEIFNTVKISFDTIEWNNQADLDPEFLYNKSKPSINSTIFNKRFIP